MIWKDVKGYEGLYQVNNYGVVRSLDRLDSRGHNLKGKTLKAGKHKHGYDMVTLSKDSKTKTYTVHGLMAVAFLGYESDCGLVVDHIDNNPNNNNLKNLQLVTQRHNVSKDKRGYTSKYVGVFWDKERSKWRAAMNGKVIGRFECEKEAAKAYENELRKL